MPFSAFDHETRKLLHQVLDGALIILEATAGHAVTPEHKAETVAKVTSQLVTAAADGCRDYETLQLRPLEGLV
jgi:hypothetical protein